MKSIERIAKLLGIEPKVRELMNGADQTAQQLINYSLKLVLDRERKKSLNEGRKLILHMQRLENFPNYLRSFNLNVPDEFGPNKEL